jgi:integrase/recombinase XerD
MTTLREALSGYLRIRRGLGFELREEGRLLEGFVEFMERAGTERITTRMALAWATQARAHPHWHRRRLGLVRGFAPICRNARPCNRGSLQGPAARPPSAGAAVHLLARGDSGADRRRGQAHTRAARTAPPDADRPIGVNRPAARGGARARRPGRRPQARCAARPGRQAQQAARGAAAHTTTTTALRNYARARDRRFPESSTPAFFIGARGRRVPRGELNRTFTQLIREVGLDGRGARKRPRPHDVRHSFAVHTLIDWYRAGEEVDRKLPLLSTYLGHVNPSSTYWYMEAVPELLALISARLEGLPEALS